MRSRYSAFVLGDSDYLIKSWLPSARPANLTLDPSVRWTGLSVEATTGGGVLDVTGTVEFTASYVGGEQHERSRFVRHEGAWVYAGAEMAQGLPSAR